MTLGFCVLFFLFCPLGNVVTYLPGTDNPHQVDYLGLQHLPHGVWVFRHLSDNWVWDADFVNLWTFPRLHLLLSQGSPHSPVRGPLMFETLNIPQKLLACDSDWLNFTVFLVFFLLLEHLLFAFFCDHPKMFFFVPISQWTLLLSSAHNQSITHLV